MCESFGLKYCATVNGAMKCEGWFYDLNDFNKRLEKYVPKI